MFTGGFSRVAPYLTTWICCSGKRNANEKHCEVWYCDTKSWAKYSRENQLHSCGSEQWKKVCKVLVWNLDLATMGPQEECKDGVWSWAQGWFLCDLCPFELCLSVSWGVFMCHCRDGSRAAGVDLIPKDLLVFHYPKRVIYSGCMFLSAGWTNPILKSGRFYQEKESLVLNVSYFYCTYLIKYFSQSGGYVCIFHLLLWKLVQGGVRLWFLQHLWMLHLCTALDQCAVGVWAVFICEPCLCHWYQCVL